MALASPASLCFKIVFTWLPVAQPSYKMGLVFPSGKNRTLACSARAQDIRICVE